MKILIVSADRSDANGHAINLGDAFLTDVLIAELEARGHSVSALDFGGCRAGGSARTAVRGLRGLYSAISDSAAVIIGGGTMLQDDNLDRALSGLPRLCVATSTVARLARRPMAFYAVGADPIRRFLPRALVLLATTGRTVMLRDAESLRRIDGETLAYAHLGADACLLPAVQRMISPPGDRSGVVFAMNGEHETMLTSSVLRYASDIGETPQLIGMSQSESVQDISNYSFEVAKGIAQIIDYPLSWTDALQTIGNARYLVASRMHALYMGLLTDTPMVAIGRSPKVASFAREFGIPLEEKLETTTLRRAKHGSANALSVAKKRASEGLDLVLESLGVSEPAIVRS